MNSLGTGLVFVLVVACTGANTALGDGGGDFDGGADSGEPGCDAGFIPGPLGGCVEKPCSPIGSACGNETRCCNSACEAPGSSGCGACMNTEDECDALRPCEAGNTCVTVAAPPCSCTGSAWNRCRATCPATPCDVDETCVEGGCRPVSCQDGFTCAAGTSCVGEGGDSHGCARISCQIDADCPGSANTCVNGGCFETAGTCSLPRP